LPQVQDGQIVYATTPDQFAECAVELVAAGAEFVGGCCGTSPEFIQAIHQRLQP
jgi:methionine synthase I (cobalamin-dependent)